MSADSAADIFRDTLAAFSPSAVSPSTAIPMVGADEKSTRILNEAAEIICHNNKYRRFLQIIYDLGRTDGALQATKDALDKVKP